VAVLREVPGADENEEYTMSLKPSRARRALVTGAVVAGVSLGTAGIAAAATSSTASPTTGSASSGSPSSGAATTPPAGDPATMTHGPNETLLTGSDLQSATAAATAAVPGATVIRAETDSSGAAPYEVHMKKSDGTYVTVELNSSFQVISTVSGFGAGPVGGQAPNGSATSAPAN
jgi:hypothetical protein